MHQLSGLDTMFLTMETPACPMHVGGVTVIDPAAAKTPVTFETVLRHVESRLDLLPTFRRRLIKTPLNLDHPYWIEDPDFELENHVRHRALPQPGGQAQLDEFICDHISRPLDRSRPLWELYYVEGLEGGRAAMVSKIHHASIDGVSGAEILANLLDLTPEPRRINPPARPWQPDHIPGGVRMAARMAGSLIGRPRVAVRAVRGVLPGALFVGRQAWRRRRDPDSDASGGITAPRTPFNRTITARRSFTSLQLPLATVKEIKNALGVTVNDVVMAVCAGALRAYLKEKGELPEAPLVAAIPVSTRSEEQKGTAGNHVSGVRASLFTQIADPLARLKAIHEEMIGAKAMQKAVGASMLQDWAQLPFPAVMAQAARLYENFSVQRYHAPLYNVVISNVPGPQVPLYLAGAPVLASYPVSIPYHGLAFNITLVSYQGNLDFGLTAHRDTLPDIDHFAELLQAALDELQEAVRAAA